MRSVFVLLVFAVGVSAFAAEGGATDASRPTDAAVVKELDKRWASFQDLKPRRFGARDLFSFALSATAADWHPERVERAFELAAQMQDRDPKSKTYGNLKWYWGDEKVDDLNAVEFCMHQGVLIRMLYADKLSAKGKEQLDELLRLGVEGVKRRGVKPGYTNIFLMHVWNLVAIGETTGRAELAQEGCQALDDWLRYTWKNGIPEYLSPTYYGVDLDCLGLLARHAKNEQARKNAEAALRLFWTDIAANWYEPSQRLGGAHSRDYDYLTGHGYLDKHLRCAGWMPGPAAPVGGAKSPAQQPASVFDGLCTWVPPPEIRAQLAKDLPRVICQRWGEKSWEYSVHYLGRTLSIGSAGACKGPEDKAFVINLPGDPKTVVCSFVMDGRGDPYGVNKAVTGGGHMKSHHLTPFFTSVQRGAEALLLASDNSKSRKSGSVEWQLTMLLSHLVIPAEAQLWAGDRLESPPETDKDKAFPAETVFFLRLQDAAVGVRFPVTLDTDGKRAPIHWVNDGLKHKAARLTCVHSETQPTGRGTVAIWARAAEGLDDAGFAEFRRSFAQAEAAVKNEHDRFEISVAGQHGPMRLGADVAKGERLARDGGEPMPENALLLVNGKEYGRDILRDAGPIPALVREQEKKARK
ncbi:MAG: hypothetical protein NTW87_27120 [Planctomycetota bacterium]|nr:hypothetical protein [Planctomycetota bacterium]